MRSHIPALLAAGALCAVGCTDRSDDASTTSAAIEEANGGFDTADEAPMFDETAAFTAAAIENEAAVADPMSTDTTVVALRARTDVARARIAMVWGQLPPDRAETVVTDWSGSIAVNRGAIVVRHRIGFEDATDRLMPRTDRLTLNVQSQTRPFVDGLVVEVLDDQPAAAAPQTLTFTRADGTQVASFEIPRLLAGPQRVDVDATGNAVAALALRDRDACDHGFMRGRWHALRPNLGRFLGVISNADGDAIGHLRGIYGQRQNGDKVFFAKVIGIDGAFRGIYAGHYDNGEFAGRWLISTGDHGRAQGHYRESRPGDEVGGVFAGRWAEGSCAADLPDAPAPSP